ncbi:DUF4145 domain-containing protein [Paraburkholderia sediminicola]|uniref:DUF4145 domain-containing protein n=1 Tax=Paraburkholderia sediminicola TaxID=458836 RepID=UPI0038B8AFDA
MNQYVAPEYKLKAFTCPHCSAFAGMRWDALYFDTANFAAYRVECTACGKPSYWRTQFVESKQGPRTTQYEIGAELMWPQVVTAPPAHPDLPENLRADVEEARLIAGNSPRGAAALLRLVIEKLVTELGAQGKDINTMIGDLVSKGLPVRIQKALDSVRVIGNNAVHAGKMDKADVASTVNALFSLVNMIVEDQITQAKQLDELFDNLPEGARNGIERRDGPK